MSTYRQNPFAKHNYIHVQRLQVCWTVWILVETPKTNQIVISKQLYLLSCLFHQDILRRQGMD